jgi:hypothetical protein
MPTDNTTPTIISDTTGTDVAQVHSLTAMITNAAAALARAATPAEMFDVIQRTTVAYEAARITARLVKVRDAHAEIIAACHKAQADALEIEAQAQCRLADEYDAAQERGEVARHSAGNPHIVPNKNDLPRTAAEVGLSRKLVHEARQVRNAERENPGVVRQKLDERLSNGEAPTRADIRRAITPRSTVAAPSSNFAPTVAPPEPAAPVVQDWWDPLEEPWCAFCNRQTEIVIRATEVAVYWTNYDNEDEARYIPYICDECASKCVEVIEQRRESER